MMDAFKSFTIIGGQSHEKTVLKFNRYGIHRISAEGTSNSHGKSAILKIIDVLAGASLDKESRLALIRDGHDYCIGSIESFNGYRLSVVIAREKSQCFYMLEYKGQVIKKTLSDDYQELIKVLNFHKAEEFDYSLNRYKTKTTLPFTHFTGRQNEKILVSASEIEGYRQKLEVLDENIATIDGDLNLNKARIASVESSLNDIKYRYTKDDIVNFNLYDTQVQNYTHSKELLMSIKDVTNVYEEIKRLQESKPVDVSFLGKSLKHLSALSTSLTEVKKGMDARTQLKELRERVKPVVDLTKTLKVLDALRTIQNLSKNIVNINRSVDEQKVEEPSISLKTLNLLGSLTDSITTALNIKEELRGKEVTKPQIKLAHLELINTLSTASKHRTTINSEIEELRVIKPELNLLTLDSLHVLHSSAVSLSSIKSEISNSFTEEVKLNLNTLDTLTHLKSNVSELNKVYSQTNNLRLESSSLMEELNSLTEELGVCPTCGGELDLERVLEHGH